MPSLQPAQARFFLELTVPWFKHEQPITKKVIEAIPLDAGDFRPHEVARTAFELAWHIASAENRFLDAVASGEFNFSGAKPEWIRNSADVAKWYAENFEVNIKRVEQLSDEQLLKIVDFRGIRQWPAVLYLQSGLHHTIHHRGQLSTYLRPLGMKVPSIYGQSYDDSQAATAAAGKR
jgi:uncharacterized damage-inducible protein DinB